MLMDSKHANRKGSLSFGECTRGDVDEGAAQLRNANAGPEASFNFTFVKRRSRLHKAMLNAPPNRGL